MNKNIIAQLEFTENVKQMHHASLWKAQEHFTWWISIIFSSQIVLILAISEESPTHPLILKIITCALSLLGFYLCSLGISTINREGRYFQAAMDKWKDLYIKAYGQGKDFYGVTFTPDIFDRSASTRGLFKELFFVFVAVFILVFFFILGSIIFNYI